MPFDLDSFVLECAAAAAESSAERAVRDAVGRVVSAPDELLASIGTPSRAGVQGLHVSETLTVLNVVWGPRMTLMPHNHNMWAVIGVYGGREDNIFWRRHDGHPRGLIEAAGAKSFGPREAHPLGPGIIHSVTNPTSQFTGAIHVYGGDFFAKERSEWDPATLEEQPYDVEKNMKLFEASNESSRIA
jgi:predicted metal-dependent enzyme (double-stranded beta helix superfamily)